MSDYVPCDGCTEEATHHLCEECCNEPTGDYARGVADERARVVADLRMLAASYELRGGRDPLAKDLADRYERGEHETEATDAPERSDVAEDE